jgi:hypothetical protein
MEQLQEVASLLQKIERTYAAERSETIGKLQCKIWDDPELQSEELYFLQELAGDLNFYEPFEPDRDTALGYYDDERLLELTGAALKKTEALLHPDTPTK